MKCDIRICVSRAIPEPSLLVITCFNFAPPLIDNICQLVTAPAPLSSPSLKAKEGTANKGDTRLTVGIIKSLIFLSLRSLVQHWVGILMDYLFSLYILELWLWLFEVHLIQFILQFKNVLQLILVQTMKAAYEEYLILDYYQKSPSRKIHLASFLSIEWRVDMYDPSHHQHCLWECRLDKRDNGSNCEYILRSKVVNHFLASWQMSVTKVLSSNKRHSLSPYLR